MPKTKISEYSATANSNTDVASINIDEGCAPSGINNAIRAVMGHLKDFQQGTNGDPFNGPVNGTVGATTPSTGAFTTLSASSTVTLSYGTANGVAYLNGSKVVTTGSALTFDGTKLQVSGSDIRIVQASNSANNGLYFRNFTDSATFAKVAYEAATGYLQVGTTQAYDTIFLQNNAEAMRLTSTGLGIGTSSPAYKLQVANNGNFNTTVNVSNTTAGTSSYARFLSISDGGNASFGMTSTTYTDVTSAADALLINASGASGGIVFSHDGVGKMLLDSSGNLLVGTTSTSTTSNVGLKFIYDASFPYISTVGTATTNSNVAYTLYSTGAAAYRFYVGYGGTVYATSTTITAISDQRLKENIRDLDDGLASVMALKPRKFDWKEGKGANIKDARGFIAQEFETVFPDMIDEWRDPAPEGEEPYKAINANLIPTLVKAIQEQQAIIQSLTARITALEGA